MFLLVQYVLFTVLLVASGFWDKSGVLQYPSVPPPRAASASDQRRQFRSRRHHRLQPQSDHDTAINSNPGPNPAPPVPISAPPSTPAAVLSRHRHQLQPGSQPGAASSDLGATIDSSRGLITAPPLTLTGVPTRRRHRLTARRSPPSLQPGAEVSSNSSSAVWFSTTNEPMQYRKAIHSATTQNHQCRKHSSQQLVLWYHTYRNRISTGSKYVGSGI